VNLKKTLERDAREKAVSGAVKRRSRKKEKN
jgi:hypothetical protein